MRGASARVPLGWLGWVVAAALAAPHLAGWVGPVGAVIALLAAGWLAARHLPSPGDWLRRYHLDDAEITAMGPGRAVVRLPWSRVHTLVQERHALRLAGDGTTVRLPLPPLLEARAWQAVLARVVPDLADEMWTLIDDGEAVRLVPPLDPPAPALAWWAWAPVLVACAVAAGGTGLAAALGLALAERAVAWLRTRERTVTLQRAGVLLRRRARGLFASWAHAEVTPGPRGLVVGARQGVCGRVETAVPNFWAAAAVIQMKAKIGPRAAAVHFRVRLGEKGFAVVGEVEPGA
jgi:hypothetical protein